ncbi:MAG TPA: hypothetical protein VM845_10840 [Burkholderiaceae bacterium]|nr:hypothetical protein [Burkholderiaceae bacterium]
MFTTALALRVAVRVSFAAAALLIGACSTTGRSGPPYGGPVEPPAVPGGPNAPGTPGATTPNTAPPPATPLATEQRYFEDWFRGTPVVIAAAATGSTLQVDVPLANSFDAGKADIKPALGAVLDRVAESLRRQVGARVSVAAPGDPGGANALAQARAERVREHLVSRRIAAPRIVVGGSLRAGAPVQLRMTIPPAAFPQAVSRYQSPNVVPSRGVSRVAATQAESEAKR